MKSSFTILEKKGVPMPLRIKCFHLGYAKDQDEFTQEQLEKLKSLIMSARI
jgi:hypothetical protein